MPWFPTSTHNEEEDKEHEDTEDNKSNEEVLFDDDLDVDDKDDTFLS